VDDNYQGKGYGREIMKQVLDVFHGNDKIKTVGISYEPQNTAAQKLYASLGFVEPGEIFDGETLAVLNLK